MNISTIKSRLPIEAVLAHYGLKADRNNMLRCPFHNDKTPSFQVYPQTGTYCCFSTNCSAGSGDQIQLIQLLEGLSHDKTGKHQALKKAAELADPTAEPIIATKPPQSQELQTTAVLSKLMLQAKDSFARSKKAQTYCAERNIPQLPFGQPGFLADRFYHRWNKAMQQTALEMGLIKPHPNGNYTSAFRNCLVFPLLNKEGYPVGIYGRALTQGHFYLKGPHRGLYPKHPKKDTQKLILTESVIDAATLIKLPEITQNHSVLALYGTNGLTPEHRQAIKELHNLKEVILFFDGDKAGEKGGEKVAQILSETLAAEITITIIKTPEGEDVNSLLQGHDPDIFTHLLDNRVPADGSKKETAVLAGKTDQKKAPEPARGSALEIADNEKLIYRHAPLHIEIWGGVEYHNLHRLKLSLSLVNQTNQKTFRDEVNLYSYRGSKAFLENACEELEISPAELKNIVESLTTEIEAYRLKEKKHSFSLQGPEPYHLNSLEKAEALTLLKSPQLTEKLKEALTKAGLVGESLNGLLLFMIFLTRYFDYPLHALVHGASGSGKTNLLKSVLKLIPEESRFSTTALTENVLYRPPHPGFWKHKILVIEDLDGIYKALLALRELMSNQHISKFASEPDPKTGRFRQVLLEARGPVVIAGATTKDKVYEDNSNRSFLLHVNESSEHRKRIMDYQNRQAAGLNQTEATAQTLSQIQNMQRLLDKKLKVVNPFQPDLILPEYIFKPLRTNTHYIHLIKAITFLHQYQRKRLKGTNGGYYIQTTLNDIALANALSKESLLRKSDELSGQLRSFFEQLKTHLKKENKTVFLSKEIRSRLRMNPMTLNRRIHELKNRGYLKLSGGNKKTGYEYEVQNWDDYKLLQDGLKVMDDRLEALWKKYPDGTYSVTV